MLNNGAWDLFDMGDFAAALPLFEQARAEWTVRGKTQQIRVARWAVGRCLRALGRHAEALATQRELEGGGAADGSGDGFVFEEIAENLAALGKDREARLYFGRAAETLSQDAWFAENEPARLAGLRERANLSEEG
jgi:tetratricopeptide (TPR) repeat protein